MLDAITSTRRQVWVAGETDSPEGGSQPLIESYRHGTWTIQDLPAIPDSSNWANLYGIALTGHSVWAAGTFVDSATDFNQNLVLEDSGGTWTVNAAPNPGTTNNILGGFASINGQLWAAGLYQSGGRMYQLARGPRRPSGFLQQNCQQPPRILKAGISLLEGRIHMLGTCWIKSSASYANSNCVEVRMRADGQVEVRNSRIPGVLPAFTPQEWTAFIDGARAGEFDLPSEAAGMD